MTAFKFVFNRNLLYCYLFSILSLLLGIGLVFKLVLTVYYKIPVETDHNNGVVCVIYDVTESSLVPCTMYKTVINNNNMGTLFGVHNRIHIATGMLLSSYLIMARTSSLRNENITGYNSNAIADTEDDKSEKISPFWSFNDSVNLTKYEQFDHQRFIETVLDPELVQPTTSTVPKTKTPPHTRRRNSTKALQPVSPPDFDGPAISNVTARLGESTFLHCTVRNLKQRPVSWVRRRDWHILSSGVFMYTNDDRFHVLHADNADNWDLQIKYVQKRDAGSYECQVAMGTGISSHYFNLEVIVPTARILGTEEYHVGKGSTINLICVIENGSLLTRNVVWVHNGMPIYNTPYNKKDDPGPISVTTEVIQPDNTIQSKLLIRGASPSALGNYTCTAPNTESDTVNVYVSEEGDNIAAIQRHGTSSSHSYLLSTKIVLPVLITLQRIVVKVV